MCKPDECGNLPPHLKKQANAIYGDETVENFEADTQRDTRVFKRKDPVRPRKATAQVPGTILV